MYYYVVLSRVRNYWSDLNKFFFIILNTYFSIIAESCAFYLETPTGNR